jgi:hypothetical protein
VLDLDSNVHLVGKRAVFHNGFDFFWVRDGGVEEDCPAADGVGVDGAKGGGSVDGDP